MRARYEKFRYGFFPKAGDPATRYMRIAVVHAKLKQGMLGIKVKIFPPDVSLPDDIRIKEARPVEEVEETGSEVLEEEKVENNKDE
jgi:small subunit ribosomal protein S3